MTTATRSEQRVIPGGYIVVRVSKPGSAVFVEEIVMNSEQRKRFKLFRLPAFVCKAKKGARLSKRAT